MISAFPKIFAIGTDYIRALFDGEVEVTEKIDGSQFVFGKVGGDLHMRSKGATIHAETVDNMFAPAVDYVRSVEGRLPVDAVFYCEYLQRPRHNILAYDRVPKNHLMCFGVRESGGSFAADHETIHQYADGIGIETVPLLKRGHITSQDELLGLLDTPSVLGGTPVEGIVVKNYEQPFLLGGQPIPLMAGKFVSERFKETHRETWGKEHTSKGRWQELLDTLCTEARWHKATQRLRESGELENEPRDIGRLLKEIQIDVDAEEGEAIRQFLWAEHKRDVFRAATRGFPEWYKQQLVARSFEETPEEANDAAAPP